MPAKLNIEVLGEVTDKTGDHRLLLRFVETVRRNRPAGDKGFNFHSLVWEINDGETWIPKIIITQSDFQRDAEYRRWINEIHSFAPDTGMAMIKVGEEGAPDDTGVVYVTCSWREWDLLGNREVRRIKVCDSAFDRLDMPNNDQ